MNKTLLLIAVVMGAGMALPCLAAQAETHDPSHSNGAVTLESVRRAFAEGRDQDVLIMAERGLIGAPLVGDFEMKAAELYFWKGSALRRLKRHDEALIALEHARSLGFAGPELFLEKGLANKTLGKGEQAEQDYQEAERRFPDDPERRELYLKHWKWDAAEQPRFQIWFAPQAGWDSNVLGLDPHTPLQQGKANFDSYYVGAYLDTKFYLLQDQHQQVWLEYQLLARDYPQEQDVSFLDNNISIAARQPILETMDFEVRGSWEEAFLRDTGHFRTQKSIGPALMVQALRDLQIRIWGDWTSASYYDSVPNPQNRDGSIARAGVTLAIGIGSGWMIGPYGSYTRTNTTGEDYDARGWNIGVQVNSPELAGFKLQISLSYGVERFENENSLTGFTKKRVDHPLGMNVVITFKQVEKWLGYAPTLAVGYVRHTSNIDEFDFTHWTPQLELSLWKQEEVQSLLRRA